jgi:hypothetical protein
MVRAPGYDKGARFSAGLFGLWLGLALLKFGNPPIFAEQIATPASLLQFILDPWPLTWAYVLSGIVFALTIGKWRWSATSPKWIVALPATWFLWQLVSALWSVDSSLTAQTLPHFLFVSGAFYFGFAVLANLGDLRLFWIFFLGAVVLVIVAGCYQHFIGLEETRRYFIAYELPKYPNGPPPELVKKLASNRIYSTLFYPNTFAAALILGLPILATKISLSPYATRSARLFLVSILGVAGVLCLFWSGSKAGWLIALIMAVFALFRMQFSRGIKLFLLIVICLAGTSGFVWRYSSYLKRGATSATARLDYWRAAARGFR